jgi:hypothetical protein
LFSKNDDTLNIAFAFGLGPEYPLISMLRDYRGSENVQWAHIRFIQPDNENRNFRIPFTYKYILTNEKNFLPQIRSAIKSVREFGLFTMVELQSPDSITYPVRKF